MTETPPPKPSSGQYARVLLTTPAGWGFLALAAFLLIALLFVVGGAVRSGSSDRGCNLLERASSEYDDVRAGMSTRTLTTAEAAAKYQEVAESLNQAASIADSEQLRTAAKDGAVIAGQFHVALSGEGTVEPTDVTALMNDFDVALGECS